MLAFSYSSVMQGKNINGSMLGIIPCIGIREFMDKLREEDYDPDHIYDVWKDLPYDLIKNNELCGVCPVGYTTKDKQINKDEMQARIDAN